MNNLDANVRIIRWLLLLNFFYLTIIDKPGKEKLVMDFLSKPAFPAGDEGMVNDHLPYEHLFSILVLSPWSIDIANYLFVAIFPPNMSSM